MAKDRNPILKPASSSDVQFSPDVLNKKITDNPGSGTTIIIPSTPSGPSTPGGGGEPTAAETATLTTPVIPVGGNWTGTLTLSPYYTILALTQPAWCRVRIYADDDGQTSDLGRQPGFTPAAGTGLVVEYKTHTNSVTRRALSPLADGFTYDGGDAAPVTVSNVGTTPAAYTIAVEYIAQ